MRVLSAYKSWIEEGQDSIKKSATWTKSGSFLSPKKHSTCTQAYPSLLSTLTSAPSRTRFSLPSLLYSPYNSISPSRGLAIRCVWACEVRDTAIRAPASLDSAQRRGDRDAKGTRAAFKLAAAKRINSPGSLDLLIRAAVAFLRGLDR